MRKILPVWLGLILSPLFLEAQPAAQRLTPNLESNIDHPLRYRPEGTDFVIENGPERFNRPLYGGNTAFRVDGGDQPEFVLYLPGRGGNLRLGIVQGGNRLEGGPLPPAKWLHEAATITTRYRPGELLYEIRDPLLGADGILDLAVLACHQTEGLVVRVEAKGIASPGLELVWAYGGVNGQRGARDGDIGTERVPISEWFQLKPEFAKDNVVEIADDTFTLRAKPATLRGVVPAGSHLKVGDAAQWDDLPTLLSAVFVRAPDRPVLVGRAPLANGTPLFLGLQRLPTETKPGGDLDTYAEAGGKPEPVGAPRAGPRGLQITPEDLPRLFAETEEHFSALRERVLVVTPDPFVNAAVGALNVAADAVWDEPQQAIMHGAIAWRTRLLGWRGPYALDALGWHDRARKHFEYWATRQNTSPIPAKLPPPDANTNLARSEAALHSNGDLSNSHYDMNLVFIDALFRHLQWTGDVEFAKKMWPVIERHLAWERRLFRREFATADGEKLPLYEAYAAIWASDDLQYGGGGSAHASAYNAWHNRMAAQLAPLVGADPQPYAKEADEIMEGLFKLLWIDDQGNPVKPEPFSANRSPGGHFAEYKDLLGRQLVHPSAALWTFYHAADSGIRVESMADGILKRPQIPVRGPGVPTDDHYGMLPSSDWMPYTWSLNNVVMGENVHTALALWQSNRPDDAFRLLKSSLLASMFMGISPGNVGSMNYLDVYRRESQRDFADGSGVLSRAIVEGLFGLKPNAFKGAMEVSPGFPRQWAHASLSHPSLSMSFLRQGSVDIYTFTPVGQAFKTLALKLPTEPTPILRITAEYADGHKNRINPETGSAVSWSVPFNQPVKFIVERSEPAATASRPRPGSDSVAGAPRISTAGSSFEMVDLGSCFNDRVTEIFRKGKYLSPRSPFVSLALPSQGIGYWAGHVNASAEIDDTGLRAAAAKNGGRLVLPNGLAFTTPGPGDAKNILFTSQWDNYPREATVPLTGRAHRVHLLMAGSTNAMQSRLDNGEVIATYQDGSISRLALRNPETWWPIEQDYFTDDYQFRIDGPLPTRVDLQTAAVRILDVTTFKGQGKAVPGGAATVLSLALDSKKELKSLTVRTLANDVVIGVMAVTLER